MEFRCWTVSGTKVRDSAGWLEKLRGDITFLPLLQSPVGGEKTQEVTMFSLV